MASPLRWAIVAASLLFTPWTYTHATAQEPKSARERAREQDNLGHTFYSKKQLDRALAHYTAAIELDPSFVSAYFSRSALHAEKHDYISAVADLTECIKLEPYKYSALFNRGLYHEYLRKSDEAIADYSKALAPEADFSHVGYSKEEARAAAYHYRGRVYQWHKHDYAKAVADYTEALRLDPDIEMVHYRRAQSHYRLGKYAEASSDYAIADKERPGYFNLKEGWAWLLATCPDADVRDGKHAIKLAKELSKGGLDTLAAAYAEAGQFELAIETQRESIAFWARIEQSPAKTHQRTSLEERRQKRQARQARLQLYEAHRPCRDPYP